MCALRTVHQKDFFSCLTDNTAADMTTGLWLTDLTTSLPITTPPHPHRRRPHRPVLPAHLEATFQPDPRSARHLRPLASSLPPLLRLRAPAHGPRCARPRPPTVPHYQIDRARHTWRLDRTPRSRSAAVRGVGDRSRAPHENAGRFSAQAESARPMCASSRRFLSRQD